MERTQKGNGSFSTAGLCLHLSSGVPSCHLFSTFPFFTSMFFSFLRHFLVGSNWTDWVQGGREMGMTCKKGPLLGLNWGHYV